MRFMKPAAVAGALALAMLAPAGAMAAGYSGNYPVTVSHSQHSDGTYCLTLKDGGSYGWPHSGYASLVIGSSKFPYGTFQVINHTLVVTIEAQGYGQNAGLVFIGSASRGNIGRGVFEDVYGGEDFDSGALSFGMKGGLAMSEMPQELSPGKSASCVRRRKSLRYSQGPAGVARCAVLHAGTDGESIRQGGNRYAGSLRALSNDPHLRRPYGYARRAAPGYAPRPHGTRTAVSQGWTKRNARFARHSTT
jgi:hypothetical protein